MTLKIRSGIPVICVLLVFACALLLAGCAQARPSQVCDAPSPIRIRTDSIGPLSLAAPLAELRRQCPTARDTVYYEHEAVFPAVWFAFRGLEVWGVQARMDEERFEPMALIPHCPADFWKVSGSNAVLPGGAPFHAPVADLNQTYGELSWFAENQVHARWAGLPGFSFVLDVNGSDFERLDQDPSLLAQSRVQELRIGAPPPGHASCPSR